MKTYLAVLSLLFCASPLFSQWFLPSDVEMSLNRVEMAIQSGNPNSIEDLIPSGITMRLEDSLYENISSIAAMDLLNKYFEDKDSIQFHFGLPGNGLMTYTGNGKKNTLNVDIWLRRKDGFPEIYALNISNYPIATVFFRIPHKSNELAK